MVPLFVVELAPVAFLVFDENVSRAHDGQAHFNEGEQGHEDVVGDDGPADAADGFDELSFLLLTH
jgi:hypothetical protein